MRCLVALLLLAASPLAAQTPYLVKDINTTYAAHTQSSNPAGWVALGSSIVFSATTPDSGTELWKTDGTSAGTSMIADIVPGSGSSNPAPLAVINGVLLFSARDVDHGIELWTTDGTTGRTHMLLDLNPGPSSSTPASPVLLGNQLLFTADDSVHGRVLWTTDGTAAGTHMVKDLNAGSTSPSGAFSLTPFGNAVYFTFAGTLWKTDGTDVGTTQVTTNPARLLYVAGSQLFFEGWSSANGWEPWVSDGTPSGTHMIADINPGVNSSVNSSYANDSFLAIDNRVLFAANDGTHGRELWVTDGTAAGTHLVLDAIGGAKGLFDYLALTGMTLNGRAYFDASDADHGAELWVSDGTEAGTHIFMDIAPGSASSFPAVIAVLNGQMIFSASLRSTPVGPTLWQTDGTVAATHKLAASSGVGGGNNTPVRAAVIGGKMYFSGATALYGIEPWVTDGTDAGTHMIANLASDRAPSSLPSSLTAAGNLVFFYAIEGTIASSGIAEWSFWRSDGTDAGTFKLTESGQHTDTPVPGGSVVFFHPDVTQSPLYVSDGTLSGTKPATDFLVRFGGAMFNRLYPFDDGLYAFVVDAPPYDGSLWKTTSDPSGQPTIRLGSRNPKGLIDVAGNKFFYAQGSQGPYDLGLWTTDGTPNGTYAIVPEIDSKSTVIVPSALVNAEGAFFFLYSANQKGALWKSDGTFDGTKVVKQFDDNPYGAPIVAAGRKAFFVMGGSLWASDGTATGTVSLMAVTIGSYNPPASFAAAGSRLVFVNHPSSAVYELWGTDGTPDGTKLLQNTGGIFPAPVSVNGVVYFAGTDALHGSELWTTDGTVDGTKLLYDVNPGPNGSGPTDFTKAGNLLFFNATTDATGTELWALPLNPALSIADGRLKEGDSGVAPMHFRVSLGAAASQPVTVDWTTADGTALAGQDYDAASGTLTFAPGETTKTIDVMVHGDTISEDNETFYVALRNASGASLSRGEASGTIIDDDQIADLSVAPSLSMSSFTLSDGVTVSNAGPYSATDVVVSVNQTPVNSFRCTTCSIAQLPPGTSMVMSSNASISSQQQYVGATVTARQHDANLANNSATWTLAGNRRLAMDKAFLTPGATATLIVVSPGLSAVPLSSSDPTVVTVPPAVDIASDGAARLTLTALQAGTSTISQGPNNSLLVTVVPAGTTPRWPGGMTMSVDTLSTTFERPIKLTLSASGRSPVSGAPPTGTVVVLLGGPEATRRTISGTSTLSVPVYAPSPGSYMVQLQYSGDANFLPQSVNTMVTVFQGRPTLTGILQPVIGSSSTFNLRVEATGSPAAAPTGTISVLNGTTEIARLPLGAPTAGTSFALTTLTGLSPSTTLTLQYSGDTNYQTTSQQVRVITTHHRPAHH